MHPPELHGVLPVPLEFHVLMPNMTVVQQLDAVTDTSMPQHIGNFQFQVMCVHFAIDNATNALAYKATFKDDGIPTGMSPIVDILAFPGMFPFHHSLVLPVTYLFEIIPPLLPLCHYPH